MEALIKISDRFPFPLFILTLIMLLPGCSITHLQHDDLIEPTHVQSGIVRVDTTATGFTGGRVGWGRMTLFSIPVAPVRIESDEAAELMIVVSDALAAAGFSTRVADGETTEPIMKANVDNIRFNNYTWLAPLMPTWGKIGVTLRLESDEGQVLWEQSFEGSGTTFNVTNGFNVAATKSITRLANSMVEAFSSEEFGALLSEGLEVTD